MTEKPTIWAILGIDQTTDVAVIRRAYAKRLKQDRPDDAQSFQLLRSAYEMALGYAHQQMRGQPVTDANEPAPATAVSQKAETIATTSRASDEVIEPVPVAQPVDELSAHLNALGLLFQQLYQALKAQDAQAARKYFDEILESSALERIDVERRVEYELANLLASTLPASDDLLEIAIKRFGWDSQIVNVPITPAMAAILNRRKDLDFRRTITYSGHPYRDAYEGLSTKAVVPVRWVKAHYHLFGRTTEHQLLQHVRREYPTLVSDFDPQIVSWLDRMANRPQPSFVLISLVLGIAVLSLLVSLYGLFVGTTTVQKTFQSQLQIFGAGTVAVCAWLVLIDWPRMIVKRKWPNGVPWYMNIGWMVTLAAVLLASSMFPSSETMFINILLLTVLCAIWSLIVTARFWISRYIFSSNAAINLVIILGLSNIALFIWWVGFSNQINYLTLKVMAAPMIAVMILSIVASDPITSRVQLKFTSLQKSIIALVVLLLAVAAIFAVWDMSQFVAWCPLSIATVILLIAISRPLNFLLPSAQQSRRPGILLGSVMLFQILAQSPHIHERNEIVMGGAFIFCVTIVMSMSMLIFNELQAYISKSPSRR